MGGMMISGARRAIVLLWLDSGCQSPRLLEGQYRCQQDQPGSCPAGWLCQCRGAGCQWLCYQSAAGYCGDGQVGGGEECDGTTFASQDACGGKGFAICKTDCTVYCTVCGNGLVEIAPSGQREECDDGNTVAGDGCSPDCKIERCGDGHIDPGEVCDDKNNISGDGCSADCKSKETCGNGYVDAARSELCDDGNLMPGDGCGPTCRTEVCGNGFLDPGELCDDQTRRPPPATKIAFKHRRN